jgi:hypothetical protein
MHYVQHKLQGVNKTYISSEQTDMSVEHCVFVWQVFSFAFKVKTSTVVVFVMKECA